MDKSVLEKIQDPPVQNKYNMTSTSQQYPPPQHGGRIPNIMDSGEGFRSRNGGMPFSDVPSLFGDTNQKDLVGTLHVRTPLNQVYFSDDNINNYLTFAKNNPETIAEDLEDLNSRVIGYAAAKIYSELDFHLFYLKDLQEFASPIANPTNVKFYGSNVNELKSFF